MRIPKKINMDDPEVRYNQIKAILDANTEIHKLAVARFRYDLDTQKSISGWAITIAVVLGLLHVFRFFL